jgi:hypothetical protein
MKTQLRVRYVSGKEERFEVELFGGTTAQGRLKEFAKDPTIVLQTGKEVIIIPSAAIESIIFTSPDSEYETIDLPNVHRATRVE